MTPAAIGVVGVGAMGGAFAAGLASSTAVIVEDAMSGRAQDVASALGVLAGDAASCDIVVVAVKPQDLATTMQAITPRLTVGSVVMSVAAGWSLDRLAAAVPGHPVVRLMPNLAVANGNGVVAMATTVLEVLPPFVSVVLEGINANNIGSTLASFHALREIFMRIPLDADAVSAVSALLAPLGAVVVMDEAHFDIATAIGGSGPGFMAYIAKAMEDTGVAHGLARADARAMVQAVIAGTAGLLAHGEDPAELQARVASPGGTTAACIAVMHDAGAAGIVERALGAAAGRAAEL